MIPVLALVVTILAVFFGPLVARANTQRQIRVTTREAWMREFREQVAHLLACLMNSNFGATRAEVARAGTAAVHLISLLIAEKGQYQGFLGVVTRLVVAAGMKLDTTISSASPQPGDATDLDLTARVAEVIDDAADILRQERAAIADDPGVWREIWTSLGLDAIAWPAWSRRPHRVAPTCHNIATAACCLPPPVVARRRLEI